MCVTPTLPPVYPRERKLRRPPRLRDPRRSRRGDGSSQIFLDSRIGLVLHLCLVSFLSNFSPPPMVTFFTCRHPPPLPQTSARLHPQASASAVFCRPSRPLCLPSSAPCVSLRQVEVGAAGRSRETLSAAVSLLPQTRG